MNQSFGRLAGSAMVWNAIQLFGNKGIFLIRMIILVRLLAPEDFGLFAIAASATGFLISITNVGLIPAAVQAENMDEAKYAAVWTFDMARSILIASLTIIFAPLISEIFAEPLAVPIIQALALRPLFESMISIKMAAFNRDLAFRPLTYLKIAEAIINAIISISLARLFGVWALVFGALGGAISMIIVSYILAPYRPRFLFNWKTVQPLLNFGGWVLITGLITMAGSYGMRIVISRQLGVEGLGLYYIALQFAYLPSDFARELVGVVAFPLFARLQRDISQATRAFRAMFSGLAAILYPVCALLIILTPSLTHYILGPNWAGTEATIRILTLVVMIGIFGEVAATVFRGFGQIYRITMLEVAQSLVTLSFAWVLTSRFGLAGAALAWLPAILISQLMSIYFIQHILDRPFQGLQGPLSAIVASTVLCAMVSLTASQLIPGIAGFLISVILGTAITAGSLWTADRLYGLGFARNLALVFPQISAFLRPSSIR